MPTRLVWMDLEMTGLDPESDLILEVAMEITDFNFTTLASYEARVNQPKQSVLEYMQRNVWWANYPQLREEFLAGLDKAKPSQVVAHELAGLINEHCGQDPAIIAGNSIHSDRKFIKRYWPEVDLKLHYRMLDVSAWKVLMQGKYGVQFKKKEVHHAFDDIQASIAELQYYLEWFKHGSENS